MNFNPVDEILSKIQAFGLQIFFSGLAQFEKKVAQIFKRSFLFTSYMYSHPRTIYRTVIMRKKR